jgi:hypothetical protein
MAMSPPEQSSLEEAVEGLFTDSGLGDALQAGGAGFPVKAESKLQDLRKELARINARESPAKIISGPGMQRVRTLAAEVLTLIGTAHASS